MLDTDKVVNIKKGHARSSKKKTGSSADNKEELLEVIGMIESAQQKLEDMIDRADENDDIMKLDEAVDALSDAVEIIEDAWDELENGGGEV